MGVSKMKKENVSILILILILILLISILSGCIDDSSKKDTYGENFEFTLLDGTKKKMSDYKGKYVFLDFFGVRCQPCTYQMLVLTQIYENYQDSNLEIISIDVWIMPPYSETPELVEQFISNAREQEVYLNWTFGVDDISGTLLLKYANEGVPMMYLLDKNGNVYNSFLGYTEYPVISKELDELILK